MNVYFRSSCPEVLICSKFIGEHLWTAAPIYLLYLFRLTIYQCVCTILISKYNNPSTHGCLFVAKMYLLLICFFLMKNI